MFWQEIIPSLLNILQLLLPRFFEHTLRHLCRHSMDVSQMVEQVCLSEIHFFLLSTSSSASIFSLFCECAFFTSVFKLHRRCPSFFLEPLVSSRNSRSSVSFAQGALCASTLSSHSPDEDDSELLRPALVETASLYLPCNTNGMCVWHLRHFDLVHTFVSEHKQQYHSLRQSTVTALARALPSVLALPSISSFSAFAIPLLSNGHRLPLTERNSTKLLRSTPPTTRHKRNRWNRDRDTKTHKHHGNKNGLSQKSFGTTCRTANSTSAKTMARLKLLVTSAIACEQKIHRD